MNAKLKKHIKAAISIEIKRSARKEAFEILSKSSESKIGEFLYYYHSDKGSIACLVLDTAKDILVKNNVMKQKKSDSFGGYIDWDVEIATNFKNKHKSTK